MLYEWRTAILPLSCAFLCGCSQNYSDRPAAEALKERQLTPLTAPDERATAPGASSANLYYAAGGRSRADGGRRQVLGSVTAVVPRGWRSVEPTSSMRIAEFALPDTSEGSDDATVAVFEGNWGTVEDNVTRWKGQFDTSDAQRPFSRRDTVLAAGEGGGGGIAVAVVDVSGTFGGGMGPAAGIRQSGFRMLGAIVDTGDVGSRSRFLYIKLLGPQESVNDWAASFDRFIESISRG